MAIKEDTFTGQFSSTSSVAVLATHFCRVDDEATCQPVNLVRALATQLYSSMHTTCYRRLLDAPATGAAAHLRRRLFGTTVGKGTSIYSPYSYIPFKTLIIK